jgi:hypothetical protein
MVADLEAGSLEGFQPRRDIFCQIMKPYEMMRLSKSLRVRVMTGRVRLMWIYLEQLLTPSALLDD